MSTKESYNFNVSPKIIKDPTGEIINTVIGTIISGAKEGECVVPGLGKIVKVSTAARTGTTNGVSWSKPAGETLKLRLSKAGKEIL